jgi:hypothetical protein
LIYKCGIACVNVSNVLSEEKKPQVIALGRLGLSLRRIEAAVHIRREAMGGYLRAASISIRPPGACGRRAPAKPAINKVITDFGAESLAIVVPEPQPIVPLLGQSLCRYREAIEQGFSRGRNAMAIWQDLVDSCSSMDRYFFYQPFDETHALGCEVI